MQKANSWMGAIRVYREQNTLVAVAGDTQTLSSYMNVSKQNTRWGEADEEGLMGLGSSMVV